MTILQALNGYYDRMAARGEAEAPGWSREKFGWCLIVDADGQPVDVLDLHDTTGKKPVVTLRDVPAAVKRTVGIAPNTLWDKTNYVFGRTAGIGRRSAEEHAAFRTATLALIGDSDDPGLFALRRFLERWTAERFDMPPFRAEMLDGNFMFRLEDDYGFIHDRPAARALIEAVAGDVSEAAFCLVTGASAPVARLHPTIKGVEGAQSSGAALVSFNLDAFESYGKAQGDNAPTSHGAGFRYGAALNRLLDRGSTNRTRIGDATVVFWADTAAGDAAADAAESLFVSFFTPPPLEDADEAVKLRAMLEAVAKGRPIKDLDPALEDGTRFHILGLSPNAARLSIRFWLSDDFGVLARRLAAHFADLAIEPSPWRTPPSVNRLLMRTTALMEDYKNIPPQLAGEVTRAVLTGEDYPRSWLAVALSRLRAGDDPGSGWHAAAMRAVLARRQRKERTHPDIPEKGETPMSLDRSHLNIGYLLGRLFAVYELAQVAALGRSVKSTMRDKYYGSASSAPASVFPLVIANGQNHLAKARKTSGSAGWAFLIERELEAIMDLLVPKQPNTLPRSLRLDDQAEFAIGYYHQRKAKLRSEKGEEISLAETAQTEGEDDND